MGRLASVPRSVFRLALGPAVVTIAIAGCSSGHKSATPPATTTVSSSMPPSTTTPGQSSTGSVSASGASSTTAVSAPTSTTGPEPITGAPGSGPRVTAYTISPAAPVCNVPTEIQLDWTSVGATSVDLYVDGKVFATYGAGHQSHLEYFACDRKPHTYLLLAHAGSKSASVSKVVTGTTNSG